MQNLVHNLAGIDKDNKYYLFVSSINRKYFEVRQSNFKVIPVVLPSKWLRVIWEQIVLPIRLLLLKIDILHSPHYTTPMLGWWFKRVVTFPDMTFFLFADKHQRFKVIFFQLMMRISARISTLILSISYSTTNDIARILSVDKKKIITTQLAVSRAFNPNVPAIKVEKVVNKYKINGRYILYVGTIEPRKNILNMVKAYFSLPDSIRCTYLLVVVGKKGWHYEQLFSYISSLPDKASILFAGYVGDDDLPALYKGASLFVYPSYYEGFGIPVLEAISCGVPTITSNISSMPEVVGDAGILIDPDNVNDIKQSMENIIHDDALCQKYRLAGLEQAKKFSWEKCARETVEAYKSI